MNADFFSAMKDSRKGEGNSRSYMYEKIGRRCLRLFGRITPRWGGDVQVILR